MLSARLCLVLWQILGSDHDHLRTGAVQALSDVRDERCMAAFVLRHHMAVDPHLGAVVHGTEVLQACVRRGRISTVRRYQTTACNEVSPEGSSPIDAVLGGRAGQPFS